MRNWFVGATLVLECLLLLPTAATARSSALKSPFAGHVHHFDTPAAAAPANCKAVPTVVHDLIGVSYYTDPQHSIVDQKRLIQNNANLQPVRDYLQSLTTMVDAAALQGDANAGACALAWIQTWAQAGALEGTVNRQGAYEHKWVLCGIALTYLKLRDTGLVPAAANAPITSWLAAATDRIRAEYEVPDEEYKRNNHAYWAGLTIAAVGIAVNDRKRLDWGIVRYRMATNTITADGALPIEMLRGERALHYHLFALVPLVMLAEIGEANGIDLYGDQHGALHRLIKRCVTGLQDPAWFSQHAGILQDVHFPLRVDEIAWMEPYDARFPSTDIENIVQSYRPVIYEREGGNLTGTFAAPKS